MPPVVYWSTGGLTWSGTPTKPPTSCCTYSDLGRDRDVLVSAVPMRTDDALVSAVPDPSPIQQTIVGPALPVPLSVSGRTRQASLFLLTPPEHAGGVYYHQREVMNLASIQYWSGGGTSWQLNCLKSLRSSFASRILLTWRPSCRRVTSGDAVWVDADEKFIFVNTAEEGRSPGTYAAIRGWP